MEEECTPVSILKKLPTAALKNKRIATQTKPHLVKRHFDRILRYSSLGIRVVWIFIMAYVFITAFFLVLFLGTAYTKEYKNWGLRGFNEFFLYPYRGMDKNYYCITQVKLRYLDKTTDKILIFACVFLLCSYFSMAYISGYGNKYVGVVATAFLMGVLLSMAEFTRAFKDGSYRNLTQRRKLIDTIEKKYLSMYIHDGTIGKVIWDVIFIEFGCCGLEDFKDMKRIPGILELKEFTKTTAYHFAGVPVSCCYAGYDPTADRWWVYNTNCVWSKGYIYGIRPDEKIVGYVIHNTNGCFDKLVNFHWNRYEIERFKPSNWKLFNYSEMADWGHKTVYQFPRKPDEPCRNLP